MNVLHDLMTAFPWITAVGSGGALGVGGNIWLRSRRTKIAENVDERDGYSALISVLREEVSRQIKRNDECEKKHDECEKRLNTVEAELRGVHRQMILNSLTSAIQLGKISPEMQASIDSLAKSLARSGDEE